MTRLLALSSVRIGLYIAASGGFSYFINPGPATLTLTGVGTLVFVLGLIGPRLPFAQALSYVVVLFAVGAVTLGLGGLSELMAVLGGNTSNSALAPVLRLVAAALGGLLFTVALFTLRAPEKA